MWSRSSTDMTAAHRVRVAVAAAFAVGVLSACSSMMPWRSDSGQGQGPEAVPASSSAPSGDAGSGSGAAGAGAKPSGGAGASVGGSGGGGAAGSAGPVDVSPRARSDFERGIGYMRSGNLTEAELEFKQVALQYPQLSSPLLNLGILYRKEGNLPQSEAALKTAVDHSGSALAWTELGATQRLRGEFQDAANSYEKAIAADPSFAPAYRNLGVVSDLYLGDAERALTAFERYKELTGEDKPVTGWIAELRQRTGKGPVRPAAKPTAPGQPGTPEGQPDAPEGQPANPAEPGSSPPAPGAPPAQAAPAQNAPGAAASPRKGRG